MKRSFLGEIYQRWKAETPSFFKKLRTLGLSLAGVATALVAIPGIPESVTIVASKFLWIGPALAAVSTLVVKPEYAEAVTSKGPTVPTVNDIKEGKGE